MGQIEKIKLQKYVKWSKRQQLTLELEESSKINLFQLLVEVKIR